LNSFAEQRLFEFQQAIDLFNEFFQALRILFLLCFGAQLAPALYERILGYSFSAAELAKLPVSSAALL